VCITVRNSASFEEKFRLFVYLFQKNESIKPMDSILSLDKEKENDWEDKHKIECIYFQLDYCLLG
jgi:hypothetical protein